MALHEIIWYFCLKDFLNCAHSIPIRISVNIVFHDHSSEIIAFDEIYYLL